ncbi:RNA methyltransferase [bacterium]|nr:RNA methyltransferase [bacterium]
MDTITSTNNELVKETAKLQQKKYRTSEFLLEGLKPIEEALACNLKIERVFINQKCESLVKKFQTQNVILTNEAVLKKISATDSAPEIVAVAKQKHYSLSDIKSAKNIILLENIKDAGNLGTIIRTAKALNFDAIILFGQTVDLYNPKTVRSAVGNLWKLPIVELKDFNQLQQSFKEYEKIATLPKSNSTVSLRNYTPKSKLLIMFGSEADGLSNELKQRATTNLTIEMNKDVESLNLSVSASIVMYEISSKQRMII